MQQSQHHIIDQLIEWIPVHVRVSREMQIAHLLLHPKHLKSAEAQIALAVEGAQHRVNVLPDRYSHNRIPHETHSVPILDIVHSAWRLELPQIWTRILSTLRVSTARESIVQGRDIVCAIVAGGIELKCDGES